MKSKEYFLKRSSVKKKKISLDAITFLPNLAEAVSGAVEENELTFRAGICGTLGLQKLKEEARPDIATKQ